MISILLIIKYRLSISSQIIDILAGDLLWIVSRLVDSPSHDTTISLLLDVIDHFSVSLHAFPLTTSSLTSWFEPHHNLLLGESYSIKCL